MNVVKIFVVRSCVSAYKILPIFWCLLFCRGIYKFDIQSLKSEKFKSFFDVNLIILWPSYELWFETTVLSELMLTIHAYIQLTQGISKNLKTLYEKFANRRVFSVGMTGSGKFKWEYNLSSEKCRSLKDNWWICQLNTKRYIFDIYLEAHHIFS